MENAVGFLRRNLMVPPLEAETHAQLGRIMLDRCDALAASSRHYRRGTAIGDVFGEDRAALMPLPSTTFDPIRWERGCLIVCVWDHLIERKRSW